MTWSDGKLDLAMPVKSLSDVPDGVQAVGLQWDEARDVLEILADFVGDAPAGIIVEYWFKTWPQHPPHMPTMDDPIDDPWQGKWLQAKIKTHVHGSQCIFKFEPLAKESPLSKNLPGVTYRRTLKVRLVLPKGLPRLQSLAVHSDAVLEPLYVRVQLGCDRDNETVWSGSVKVFNGKLKSRP